MAYKKKYAVIAVIGMGVAASAAWWWQQKPQSAVPASAPAAASAGPSQGPGAGGGRTPAVEVAKAESVTLVDEAQSVGSLRSRQSVMLRPEVAGRVKEILFKDGQGVQKGQLLIQLDDQLQTAQVAQARAEMSIALSNHKRNQELVAQNFISKRSLDESGAALEVAQAKLDLAIATQQRLKIVAPFGGVAGLKQVSVGDYLKDGADIVNIEDLDAVLVDFRLPERFQSKIQPGQKTQLIMDALPGRPFSAVVQAVDPLIDASGRSVGVRGCIDNRQQQLRPGMFARVKAVFGVRENTLVVPEEAIVPQGGKAFVVKIVAGEKPDELVSLRVAVKLGARQPGKVEVLEGLQAGDSVVTAGHQRLQKDGTAVKVVDTNRAAAQNPQAAASSAATSAQTGGPSSGPSGGAANGAPPTAPTNATKTGMRPAASAKAAPAVSGPNPCLRG